MRDRADNDTEEMERLLRKALQRLKIRGATARVFFLPDDEMRRLGRRYLGERKKHVDVLAFPDEGGFPHPEAEKEKMLGDVYLRDGLRKMSRELRAFFLFHGLLHLLGYTHDGENDTIQMEDREQVLFKCIFPETPHPWPRTTIATVRRARKNKLPQ